MESTKLKTDEQGWRQKQRQRGNRLREKQELAVLRAWETGQKDPCAAQGAAVEAAMTCNEKEPEKEHTCVTVSLCCLPEANTTL